MYELRIGWRYLYRGNGSPGVRLGLLISLAVTALGAILFFSTSGSSGIGVVALGVGMLATVTFALLNLFSVFTTVSVLGVVLGVAALTVVLSVTSGFQEAFRAKVLGVNAHVIIMKNTDDFTEYRKIEKLASEIDSRVIAVQPFIFVEMLVTRGKGELSGVALKGIDPDKIEGVLDLHKHMIEGSVDVLRDRPSDGSPAPIVLGQVLAQKLKADLGDVVTVVAPLSNVDVASWTSNGEAPKSRKFVIRGLFYSGFDEYDRRLMYVNLAEAQELQGQGDKVMGVEMKVSDVEAAKPIAAALDQALGGSPYFVQDWFMLNENLFSALTMQKVVLVIFLTLIIAVATFNMISALTMMVIDKTREIAILKSMGASDGGILRSFMVVGLAIGSVGTIFGLAIGVTFCKLLQLYNFRLDPKVYLIDSLPITIHLSEIWIVGAITMVISAIATIFPSIKAGSLLPVDGLRYD